MNKTVYIPILQYTANRHQTFLEDLCKHFTVIISKRTPVALQSANIVWVEDILMEEARHHVADTTVSDFESELSQFCAYTKQCLMHILSTDISNEMVESEVSSHRTELQTIYEEAIQLMNVSQRRKIDFVIASCDYAYLSRPAVYMARLLGIHTVNVFHGYFGIQLHPSAWDPPLKIQRSIADTVVVDNELEAQLFNESRIHESTQQYLPLGTPMDTAVGNNPRPLREDAISALQLDPRRKTVVMALSWTIPYNLDGLLAMHRNEVTFVESVMAVVAGSDKYNNVQMVVKLHPATKNFKEDKNVIRFYKSLVQRYGMHSRTAVTATRFDDVLPGADVVVGWTLSSVLYDAVLEGVPAAYYPAAESQRAFKDDPNCHSEVAIAGLFRILQSPKELENYLDSVLAESHRENHRKKRDAFMQKWHITRQDVRQKSMNVVNWLQKYPN